jgi:hypothetical protein
MKYSAVFVTETDCLWRIQQLGFVMEKLCFLSTVGTEFWNLIHVNFSLQSIKQETLWKDIEPKETEI